MTRSLKGLYHLLIALFANIWFGFPARRLTIIGVTGTDGKTTTTTLIYSILKKAGYKVSMISSVHAVIGNKTYDTGFHVTTPDAFYIQKYLRQAVDSGDTHMVLEVTSHGLAQYRVFGIPFTIGVITNITHEHLDWHRSFEEYRNTKLSLLRRSRSVVLNRDTADVYNHAIPYLRNKRVVTYAIRRDAIITPKTYRFSASIPGEFNTYNCLAAIAVSYLLEIPKKTVVAAVKEFGGIEGRMEFMMTKPYTVIVDFAHTPNAIEQSLKTAKSLTKKRLIHVFGSAGLRDKQKRPVMGAASGRYADIIVLTEEDYRTEDIEHIMDAIALGIPGGIPVYRIAERKKAIRFALDCAKTGDLVMITGKGHEKSLCRGTKEYPWSDQKAVRDYMEKH